MKSRMLRVVYAGVVLLAVTGCRPVMQAHFSDARSPGPVELSGRLDDLATADSEAMCAAGTIVHTEDPLDTYGGADDLAADELVGVTPLDPGIAKRGERLTEATNAIWAQWRDDPVVTDPAYDVLGVGYEVCGSNLYYTAILVDRPGPWPTDRVELPTLGGSNASAEGVSESGFVVGMSTLPGDDAFHAYRWAWPDEAVTDLGTLGGADSIAFDVNDGGSVVGSSSLADGQVHVFLVEPGGTIESLGTLGGTQSAAYAVNDAGVVVGSSTLAGDEGSAAFRWDPATGEMTALPGLSAEYSVAHDVNDAGLVVGETLVDDGRMAGFVWSPEAGTRILDDGVADASLLDVNEEGVAVGDADQADSLDRQPGIALAANSDRLLPMPVGLGGNATAYASNEELVVVGQSGLAPTDSGPFDPDELATHVGFIRTSTGQVLTPEGTLTSSIFRDVSRELAVGTVAVAEGESRAVVQPLSALAPSETGPLVLVPVGGAAIAVVSPLALAGVLIARRRRSRGSDGSAPEPNAMGTRWVALGLTGAVVVSLAIVASPSVGPAAAQATPCAAEQEVLDNQRAYLADMKAALAAGPSEADVETALNIEHGVFDQLHDALDHREDIQARVSSLQDKAGVWHQWFDQPPPDESAAKTLLGPLKEYVDGEITDKAVAGAQKFATYLAEGHPEQLPGALPRGLLQAGLRESAEVVTLAEPIGRVAGGVGIGLSVIQISYAVGGLLAGTQLAVEGQALLDDIGARPPATLDQIAQLSTVYNQNLDHWAQISNERDANKARVEQSKALVQDALGRLNQCRKENGLGPITLPADELPGDEPQAGADGDPHLVTFDGLKYDFQAEGEFWMVRSPTDDFGIQIRTTHGTPTSAPFWAPGRVAWIDGVGIVTPGGHSVVYQPGLVLIDGAPPAGLPMTLDDGTFVHRVNTYRVEVILADGTLVSAFFPPSDQYAWWSGVNVTLADARRGHVVGLLGDADGSPVGDGKSAAGDVVFGPGTLAAAGAQDLLYGEFGPSWLVDPADRVLPGAARPYRAPEAFPADELSFPQGDIDAVHDQCVATGLAVAPALDWCIFDSLVTGVHPADVDPALTGAWAESITRDGLGIEATGEPREIVDAGNTPVVSPLRDVSSLSAGESHTCAVAAAGAVYCWGTNNFGQLGDGTTLSRSTPTAVVGLPEPAIQVTANGAHSCALTESSAAWCWGYNARGQLGDGTTTNRATPIAVAGLPGPVEQIDAGDFHTCARTPSGAGWCWGTNQFGELGIGTQAGDLFTAVPVPHQVVGLTEPIAEIDADMSKTCAWMVSGAAWCWGRNFYGDVGDGTTTVRIAPVAVTGLPESIAEIDASDFHTCARTVSGAAWCWGRNGEGDLGDGTTTNQATPVRVVGLPGPIAEIDDGNFHTCVRTVSGAVWCWGRNSDRRLGDGTTTNRPTPVAVVGLPEAAVQIAAGNFHTCARLVSGVVWCWGSNVSGQLGDGTITTRTGPVQTGLPAP